MPLPLISLILTLFLPFYASGAFLFLLAKFLEYTNDSKRTKFLQNLGLEERDAATKRIVGLFHPYWFVSLRIDRF